MCWDCDESSLLFLVCDDYVVLPVSNVSSFRSKCADFVLCVLLFSIALSFRPMCSSAVLSNCCALHCRSDVCCFRPKCAAFIAPVLPSSDLRFLLSNSCCTTPILADVDYIPRMLAVFIHDRLRSSSSQSSVLNCTSTSTMFAYFCWLVPTDCC